MLWGMQQEATPAISPGGFGCPGPCSSCGHRSDCAVHNEPALRAGPCDCGWAVRRLEELARG